MGLSDEAISGFVRRGWEAPDSAPDSGEEPLSGGYRLDAPNHSAVAASLIALLNVLSVEKQETHSFEDAVEDANAPVIRARYPADAET